MSLCIVETATWSSRFNRSSFTRVHLATCTCTLWYAQWKSPLDLAEVRGRSEDEHGGWAGAGSVAVVGSGSVNLPNGTRLLFQVGRTKATVLYSNQTPTFTLGTCFGWMQAKPAWSLVDFSSDFKNIYKQLLWKVFKILRKLSSPNYFVYVSFTLLETPTWEVQCI